MLDATLDSRISKELDKLSLERSEGCEGKGGGRQILDKFRSILRGQDTGDDRVLVLVERLQ